jgi:hypothetical protein
MIAGPVRPKDVGADDATEQLETTLADALRRVCDLQDDAVDARVERLEREVHELRDRLAAVEARDAARAAGLLAGDAALAIALLPALDVVLGGADPFLADFVSDTRDPNVRFILGRRRSTKSIGKWLARIEGHAFAGFVVVDAGKVRNCRQWRLQRVLTHS